MHMSKGQIWVGSIPPMAQILGKQLSRFRVSPLQGESRGSESLLTHKEAHSNLIFRTSLLNQYSEHLLPVKLGYSSVVEQQIHILQAVGSIPTIPTIKSERRAHHLLLSNHSPISKVAKFLVLFRPAIYFLLQINRKNGDKIFVF